MCLIQCKSLFNLSSALKHLPTTQTWTATLPKVPQTVTIMCVVELG